MVTVEEIREVALTLPRSDERMVGDRLKFRVGRLVYLSISADETLMGFAYPKEQRDGLIASDPVKFLMPIHSDERYNWVRVRLGEIDRMEMTELVVDAWRMVVPRRLAVSHLGD